MKNLTDLYEQIKEFADNHPMVSQFTLVGDESELQGMEFEYRSLVLIPSGSNISRDLNRPTYTLDFILVLFDRVELFDALQIVKSSEENVFVIGQLQDYLMQWANDIEVDFNNIDIINSKGDDYNLTSALCEFSVELPRSPYIKNIAQ
jgi:hypothetical protein